MWHKLSFVLELRPVPLTIMQTTVFTSSKTPLIIQYNSISFNYIAPIASDIASWNVPSPKFDPLQNKHLGESGKEKTLIATLSRTQLIRLAFY